MEAPVLYVVAIVAGRAVFDFINGFHDSANSIATVVSTRVLSPGIAVLWAAFFNFMPPSWSGPAVAKTLSKGLIEPSVRAIPTCARGLLGAIIWNMLTW
jgi:PiT family inorganic phosphate transporter